MRMIEIEVAGKGKALAKLDERNPGIREAFFRKLPMEGTASLWGEEVYFDLPLQMENENPSPTVNGGVKLSTYGGIKLTTYLKSLLPA